MKMKLTLIASLLFLALYVPRASSDEGPDYLQDPARIEWRSAILFEGSFEDGTPFQMRFPFPTPATLARDRLLARQAKQGSYWYPRKFRGDTIWFEVESLHEKAFRIVTMADNDKEVFQGAFSSDHTSASGLWVNGKHTKKLRFTMHRLLDYKSVHVAQEGTDGQTFDASFPVVANTTVADWVHSHASTCWADECSNGVEVLWLSNRMMVLSGSFWGYDRGTPHGRGFTETAHFDTTPGTVKQVDLDYFINTSPECLDNLSQKVGVMLPKKFTWAESVRLREHQQDFLATPQGIIFHVDDGTGAYIHESADVLLERSELGSCLKYLPRYD